MSERSAQITVPALLDSAARVQLVQSVARLLPFHSLLPPAITVQLQLLPGQSEGAIEVTTIAGSMPSGDASDAICDVTGCFDPGLCSSSSRDVGEFREWAVRNPEHPFAVHYQPLAAWLLAARCDPRFLCLAEDFVRHERVRLQCELIAAATRLLGDSRSIRRRA